MEMNDLLLLRKMNELAEMKVSFNKRIETRVTRHVAKFIEDNCPYKKDQVLEIKSMWRTRLMRIDTIRLQWVNKIPVLIAHGFFLDKLGNPTKRYNKKGVGVYNITQQGLKVKKATGIGERAYNV